MGCLPHAIKLVIEIVFVEKLPLGSARLKCNRNKEKGKEEADGKGTPGNHNNGPWLPDGRFAGILERNFRRRGFVYFRRIEVAKRENQIATPFLTIMITGCS
jgi:hypothetical protein